MNQLYNNILQILLKNTLKTKPPLLSFSQQALGKLQLKDILTCKFRENAIGENEMKNFQKTADRFISRNEPIEFIIPIGGYKKWVLSSSPEADWAEFFHLSFMKDLALILCEIHNPGVKITYLECDLALIDLGLDNLPLRRIDAYHSSFEKIVGYFNNILGETKITISLKKLSDKIDKNYFIELFEKNLEKAENFWKDKNNYSITNSFEKKASRNYYYRQKKPDKNRIRTEAKKGWSFLKSFLEYPVIDSQSQIGIILRKGPPQYLQLKPYYNTAVQFWAGEGAVVKNKDKCYFTILPFSYLKQHKPIYTLKTNDFSFLGKDLEQIKFYRK